jgi:DNA-binding transcriptional MerR regulator
MNTAVNFVFTSEAARILQCSAETVRELHRVGTIRAVILDRGVRVFERGELERVGLDRARKVALIQAKGARPVPARRASVTSRIHTALEAGSLPLSELLARVDAKPETVARMVRRGRSRYEVEIFRRHDGTVMVRLITPSD